MAIKKIKMSSFILFETYREN